MRIQHNIMAMSAYRNYTNNVAAMKKNLEKLSSGYKINRAGDDAAGLAISEKMRAQITGLETAQKNAKDGISLVQTAEGALTEVHDMLNRMVELATQSANGTYDNDTDRYQLQKEMDQLRAEIDRIADSSNFNGIMLLDGSMDAGGDVKFTAGSFQFSAAHPAGIGNNYELPKVGSVLGENTVLHTNGTKGGDTNAFSIDLENVEIKAGKSIDITIGGDVKITVTAAADKPAAAKDIIQAIADKVAGNTNTSGIDVDFGDTATIAGGKLKIGDAEFELKANNTRLTFTQKNDVEYKMPKEVTVDNSEPMDINGYAANIKVTKAGSSQSNATMEIDLSGLKVDKAGTLRIDLGGKTYDIKVNKEMLESEDDIGKLVADALFQKMGSDAVFKDDAAGEFKASANSNGKITLTSTEKATIKDEDMKAGYEISITDAGAGGGYEAGPATSQTVSVVYGGTSTNSEVTDWGNGDETVSAVAQNLAAGKTYSFTVQIGDASKTFTVAVGSDSTDNTKIDPTAVSDVKSLLGEINRVLADQIKAYNEANKGAVAATNGDYIEITGFNLAANKDDPSKLDLTVSSSTMTYKTSSNFSGDYNKSTTVLETKSDGVQDRLASTYFDLRSLADDEGHIAEGTTITIGRDTYTFTYDTNKIGKDGYVVLDGGEKPSTLADAALRLTKAAEKNGTYTVGWDDTYVDEKGNVGRITITEKEGQTNFDLATMEGIERSLGYKIASTNPTDNSKGLTLQIGDTAESYNQLKVNIKDCHTKALGLDLISIANQADAADAVNSIKAAINYVSDVRGTLGATQNRLDHTINNLSVMTENIQDAESTVRDVDIAEEMMAYTKNNILIQSAQAMLAQANQVPQGVLQLLQ